MKRLVYILIAFNAILATIAVCLSLLKHDSEKGKTDNREIVTICDTIDYNLADADKKETFDQQNVIPDEESNKAVSSPVTHSLSEAELQRMTRDNPFYQEAAKVLSGKLKVDDAQCRTMILNYCEHFRSAYDTKDLDFIRQVFSENALIIVGKVIKSGSSNAAYLPQERVEFNVRSKQEYLTHLSHAFEKNAKIKVRFSSFSIMRHPTVDGIYGVTLRQKYESDTYKDDGYLFLLWDFRNSAMPMIHVRTWQPTQELHDEDDVLGLGDFNLK